MAWHLYASLRDDGTWARHDAATYEADRAPAGNVEYSVDGCWAQEYVGGELARIFLWLDGSVPVSSWKRAEKSRKELLHGKPRA